MRSVDNFIARSVHSVEQLEILLLLHRSNETLWTVDAIASQLSLRPEVVAARCRDMVAAGMLLQGESTAAYRFNGAGGELTAEVDALAAAYRDRRISVINAVYAANLNRLRSFADAFRLGGKKE